MSIKVPEHKVIRDENGDLICNRCHTAITDREFHFVMYHPDHPTIPIGPLHEDCIPFTKLCTSCFKPCSLYTDDEEGSDEIIYFGDSSWLCLDCAKDYIKCDHCGGAFKSDKMDETADGKKFCISCFSSHAFSCSHCSEKYSDKSNIVDTLNAYERARNSPCLEHHNNRLCTTCYPKVRKRFPVTPVYQCKCCGDIKSGTSKSGYCLSCRRSDRVNKCDKCKKWDHKSVVTKVGKDKELILCTSCHTKGAYCGVCATYHTHSNLKDNGVFYAPNRSGRGTITPSLLMETGMGEGVEHKKYVNKICKGCIKTEKKCPVCHSYTDTLLDFSGYKYCGNCRGMLHFCDECDKPHVGESLCRPNSEILSYGYRPEPIFKMGKNEAFSFSTLFMGIENEVTFRSSITSEKTHKQITQDFDATELYIKHDSSISGGRGLEIVTFPMTLAYIKERDWNDLFKHPFRDHHSCGMHIHVNRSSFTSIGHIFKFTRFFNNWDKLRTLVAGRDTVMYASKSKKNMAKVCMKKENTERYSIVNFQPDQTIEVRIFAGCTTTEHFLSRIEFTHAVHTFAKDASNKSTEKDFLKWMKDKVKVYPTLSSLIKEEV